MSIAELKRRLQKGTKLTLLAAPWLPEGQTLVRTVEIVQTNAIAMAPANLVVSKPSWLYWKGLAVEDHGDGTFTLYWKNDPGSPRLKYRFS